MHNLGVNLSTIRLQDADDVEEFFLETTGMKPGYFQLSAGTSGLDMQMCELAGISLIWTRGEGRIRWRDQMTGDGLHVGFAVESEGSIYARGLAIDRDDGQVWMRDEEMDLVMNGPYLSLDIGVSGDLLEQLGWEYSGAPLQRVNAHSLDLLVQSCHDITQGRLKSSELELRDHILDRLEPVLQPWQSGLHEPRLSRRSDSAAWRLLRASDQVLDGFDPADRWKIDDLADSLGVPRRTLFQAYRSLLGVGPKRYFEIQRLHALRRSLKQANIQESTITQIASDLGFSDMGRLAARYRQQFGEYPSSTLKSG